MYARGNDVFWPLNHSSFLWKVRWLSCYEWLEHWVGCVSTERFGFGIPWDLSAGVR